jgi:hypothetical protein
LVAALSGGLVRRRHAGGGPLPNGLERFPTAEQWQRYWPEVHAAWNRGETPANFRSRSPPAYWQAMVRSEETGPDPASAVGREIDRPQVDHASLPGG